VFSMDPTELNDDDWTELHAQALWVKRYDLRNLSEMLGEK